MEDLVLGKVKGRDGEIQVRRSEYKGKQYVSIRNWYQKEGETVLSPGKGVSLTLEQARILFPAIKEAIEE